MTQAAPVPAYVARGHEIPAVPQQARPGCKPDRRPLAVAEQQRAFGLGADYQAKPLCPAADQRLTMPWPAAPAWSAR